MNPDGSGPDSVTNDPRIDLAPNWSPDRTRLAFERTNESARHDPDAPEHMGRQRGRLARPHSAG